MATLAQHCSSNYFRYDSLPHRSIRLLRIRPFRNPGDIAEILEVDLISVSLDNSVVFDALSYTWGPATLEEKQTMASQIFTTVQRCYPVACQGTMILVTKSLRDALSRIRKIDAYKQYFDDIAQKPRSKYLWADGICINQENLSERGAQVALMGDIYKRANTVLAYLGERDLYSDNGMAMSVKLAKLNKERLPMPGTGSFNDPNFYKQRGEVPPSSSEWFDWVIFMCREWFFRTWVMQEVVLGGVRDVVVLCGSKFVGLQYIISALYLVFLSKWQLQFREATKNESLKRQLADTFEIYRESIDIWTTSGHPMYAIPWTQLQREASYEIPLLNSTSMLSMLTTCSDPRDKIVSSSRESKGHPRSIPHAATS